MRAITSFLTILWIATSVAVAAEERRIFVTGEGIVEAVPDMATINLAISTEARSAAAALKENSAATSALLAAVLGFGIAERDIQTSGLSLSPVWNNANNEKPVIVGYSARNQVTVRVRDLGSLGTILDAVVQGGANEFNGLQFGLQQPVPAIDKARGLAVKDAVKKAALYADAAGVELGKIMNISENGASMPQPSLQREMAMSDAVPIAGGEIAVQASVSISFAIED